MSSIVDEHRSETFVEEDVGPDTKTQCYARAN